MAEPLQLEHDPARARHAVTFKSGGTGLIITAEKLRQDVEVLRQIAVLVGGATFGKPDDKERVLGALNSLATQFEQAADGNEPQAP